MKPLEKMYLFPYEPTGGSGITPICRLPMKIFRLLIFFYGLFFTINVSSQALDTLIEHDSVPANTVSEVDFLIDLVRIIDIDRQRLEALREDSAKLEPIFKSKSAEFFLLDSKIDSGSSSIPGDATVLKYQRQNLRNILDFLLARKRALALQVQIVQNKIAKETAALKFFVKGESFSITEMTLESRSDAEDKNEMHVVDDSLSEEYLYTYNSKIVSQAQEISRLQASLQFRIMQWEFIRDLLALNRDDLATATVLTRHSARHKKFWTEELAELNRALSQTSTSSSEEVRLKEAVRTEITQVILPALNRIGLQDSVLIASLKSRIVGLEKAQPPLEEALSELTGKVEKKVRWLDFLKSPFGPDRVSAFLFNQGPRILIVLGLLLLSWLGMRALGGAVINRLNFKHYKTEEERQERIVTLKSAYRSGIGVVFFIIGSLFILAELGIDLSVILGGAAVISVAIAFGAQSLIKDFFTGFMVLSENQYRIGNVIQINGVTGVVEEITLRMTTLRDLDGIAHFIPHGEIKMVSNYAHGWSRVNVDIRVSYRENVDLLISLITEIANELKADKSYGKFILGDPEIPGVDAFEESYLLIKVLIQTSPQKQWIIKREFLRRVKNIFDERGIDIAIPIRKIVYENEKTHEAEPNEGMQS
jgi:small-conductance mechanosensitive channel